MLICNNVVVNGRRTSMRLEKMMWQSLRNICNRENIALNDLVSRLDSVRRDTGLSTAVRMFILVYYRWLLKKYEPDTYEIPEKYHPCRILNIPLSKYK